MVKPFRSPSPTSMQGRACCTWENFESDFKDRFLEFMGVAPTNEVMVQALKEWKSSNTGYEAAHNACRRSGEQVNQKQLVCIGGKNYAEAGSALALKYGKPATQPQGSAKGGDA